MSHDAEIERLRALHEADPQNAGLEYQYLKMLLRAGRREELEARLKLRFVCPKKWEELEETEYNTKRFCDQCERSVFFVSDEDRLEHQTSNNRCVSAPLPLVLSYVRRLRQRLSHGPITEAPCAVVTEMQSIDLDSVNIPSDFPDRYSSGLYYESAFFPYALTGNRLSVAVHEPLSSDLQQRLRAEFLVELEMRVTSFQQLMEYTERYQYPNASYYDDDILAGDLMFDEDMLV